MAKKKRPKSLRVVTVGDLKRALAKYSDDRPVCVTFVGCYFSANVSVGLHGVERTYVEIRGNHE